MHLAGLTQTLADGSMHLLTLTSPMAGRSMPMRRMSVPITGVRQTKTEMSMQLWGRREFLLVLWLRRSTATSLRMRGDFVRNGEFSIKLTFNARTIFHSIDQLE